jgi:hypothetical protein
MENFNINFNNKNYEIDGSSLAPAATNLQSHLSTAMNGTGSTIKFGDAVYNISSDKLTTAMNKFVTRLGTIAGNGPKVVINGIEYSVDSAKVQGTMTRFEDALSDLSNSSATDNVAVLDDATLDYVILA